MEVNDEQAAQSSAVSASQHVGNVQNSAKGKSGKRRRVDRGRRGLNSASYQPGISSCGNQRGVAKRSKTQS
jgi:hypothetical protein